MVRDIVLKRLNESQNYLYVDCKLDLKEKHDKRSNKLVINDKSPYDDKLVMKLKDQITVIDGRIQSNKEVFERLFSLHFTKHIPENMKPLLSKFGTFCDRTYFYYTSDLENMNAETISYIVFCEFFNAFQDYYSKEKLTKETSLEVLCNSLLMMHHIGIIREKLWYGQSNRLTIYARAQEKYPYNKFCAYVFEPNKNACQYLHNKMLTEYKTSDKLAIITEKATTLNVMELRVVMERYVIWSSRIRFESFKRNNIYIDVNENLKRLTGRHKIVREHKELVNLADKLSR